MTVTATATIFFYEEPNIITSPVTHGMAIGEQRTVLDVVRNLVETWTLTSEGWLLVWNGNTFGEII